MRDQEPEFPPHVVPGVRSEHGRAPRVFSLYGTAYHVVISITGLACMIALPWWTPPWYILLLLFAFVFVNAGVVALGRIEAERSNTRFIYMVKRQSDINKRRMN